MINNYFSHVKEEIKNSLTFPYLSFCKHCILVVISLSTYLKVKGAFHESLSTILTAPN